MFTRLGGSFIYYVSLRYTHSVRLQTNMFTRLDGKQFGVCVCLYEYACMCLRVVYAQNCMCMCVCTLRVVYVEDDV